MLTGTQKVGVRLFGFEVIRESNKTFSRHIVLGGKCPYDGDHDQAKTLTTIAVLESEPYSGNWSLVKVVDGFALDRRIHASGGNFFFMATEVKAMFFGALGAKKIQNALKRILRKVKQQNFNGLEVTEIVAKRFLGLPYGIVSAHSRHVQQSCYLDSADVRRTSRRDAEWARG